MKRAESFNVGRPRNITAPFQSSASSTAPASATTSSSSTSSSSPKRLAVLREDPPHHDINDYTDYRSFTFKNLEDFQHVTLHKYCGPTPESNWVIPGVLLVGAYPASQDDGETFELVTSILKLGVTKFVCLQQEYRTHGVTEAMWRNGQALRPYFNDVKLVVQCKHSIPELAGYPVVSEDRLSFEHFPIRDCGVTDDSRVLELAKNLVHSISQGEVIYLHCWGGHGRTGTLVSIMLHLMYGLSAPEAMYRCQFVHDLRQCPVEVGSPQTQAQRDQVTRVIARLANAAAANRLLRRTVSDVGEEHESQFDAMAFEDKGSASTSVEAGVLVAASVVAKVPTVVMIADMTVTTTTAAAAMSPMGVISHSPRAPDAMAITHHKGEGHPHYPLVNHLIGEELDVEHHTVVHRDASEQGDAATSENDSQSATSTPATLRYKNTNPNTPSFHVKSRYNSGDVIRTMSSIINGIADSATLSREVDSDDESDLGDEIEVYDIDLEIQDVAVDAAAITATVEVIKGNPSHSDQEDVTMKIDDNNSNRN